MMNKLLLFCFFLPLLQVLAAPVKVKRAVWIPPITSPTKDTVWKSGQTVTVTWDTATIPPDSELTNPNGTIYLGFWSKNGGENLNIDEPLAENFPLKAGKVSFKVPALPTRNNYIVVVFGNSGNASPSFRIEGSGSPGPSSTSTRSSASASSSTSFVLSPSTTVTDPIPISGTTITGNPSLTETGSSASSPTSAQTPSASPSSSQAAQNQNSAVSSGVGHRSALAVAAIVGLVTSLMI